MTENPMRKLELDKITINLGCGGEKEKLERAERLIKLFTKSKPVVTLSKKRSTFGVAKEKPVGVKTTLRGQEAMEFLKLALAGVDNRLKRTSFDNEGNFSFGVKEYIEMPGIKYDHEIGMLGFDVAVTLKRSGFRISERKIQQKKIPASHKISMEESIAWAKENLGVEILESE